MTVTVNGEPRELAPGATVSALLETLGLARAACAVEVNRELVPKKQHPLHALADGDRIEVVSLVGGG
ncbi:MAG: sulfur carrier protein ThiS [Phycisphaerae bacterium]|nr:sulfur carrier protein ThiS [Phycisphaerae bacterium]